MDREVHAWAIPSQHFEQGGVFYTFTQVLPKDAKVLGVELVNDRPCVVCMFDPKQIHYETHRFFAVALGNVANLCVDDVYCGMLRVGRRYCALFHQPAKTRPADPSTKE